MLTKFFHPNYPKPAKAQVLPNYPHFIEGTILKKAIVRYFQQEAPRVGHLHLKVVGGVQGGPVKEGYLLKLFQKSSSGFNGERGKVLHTFRNLVKYFKVHLELRLL